MEVEYSFDSLIRHFRKFKSIDNLDVVCSRIADKTKNTKDLILVESAADHRRAEIMTNKLYDAGQVPAHAWASIL